MPERQRFIRAAVVGLPNAGKSTLVNKITDATVSAVSRIAHTTDENTLGIKSNFETGVQVAFVDTPGLVNKYDKKQTQVNEAWKEVDGCDLILFVVDGARRLDDTTVQVLQKIKEKT